MGPLSGVSEQGCSSTIRNTRGVQVPSEMLPSMILSILLFLFVGFVLVFFAALLHKGVKLMDGWIESHFFEGVSMEMFLQLEQC